MAYNGGIRFTPDIYYEIKEDGGDITVLRNGEEIGGGGGAQVMMINLIDATLDHTWNEIKNAMENGQIPIIHEDYPAPFDQSMYYYVSQAALIEGSYKITAITGAGSIVGSETFSAANPDAYPVSDI